MLKKLSSNSILFNYNRSIKSNPTINPVKKGISLKSNPTPKSGLPSIKIPSWTTVTINAATIKKRKEKSKTTHNDWWENP